MSPSGTYMYVPFLLRAGTGVVFNNRLSGTYTRPVIMVDNQRSCLDCCTSCDFTWDRCDGDSPYDGNLDSSGYPCRDQIGRSTDSGRTSPQSFEPLYEWNNTYSGQDVDIILNPEYCSLQSQHVIENRDYYNDRQRAGYAPYQYPHPLASGSTPPGIPGDLNGDSKVDISDLVIVATNFGRTSGFDVRANVVSSSPEVIDISDLSFVARRFTG